MKKSTTKAPQPKKRQTYTLDQKASAKKYYLIGLSLVEVGKLTDTPNRTIEKWYKSENWKSQKEVSNIKIKANDLFLSGKSYQEIAVILNISKPTVYRYLKTARNEKRID